MLQWVSKNYGARLSGIFFDNRFKERVGYARTRSRPNSLTSAGLYIGPRFEHFKKPATYATEIIQPTAKGEKAFMVMRRHFPRGMVQHRHPGSLSSTVDYPDRVFTPKEFNNYIAPYSQAAETSRLLVKDDAGKACRDRVQPWPQARPLYRPGGRPVHQHPQADATVKPYDRKLSKSDIAPFLEFMEHLIPIEHDRRELMRWCATLIAKPDVKMHYGVLLISETQGVGKGTLGEKILAPLVGVGNTSFPGEEEIVDSKYNYWMAHRRLAVVHEIYAGHSSRAYNKLKSVITDYNIRGPQEIYGGLSR
jgi:hypothetical protein